MTRNDCYKTGRKIIPKGIMAHSTATPGVMAEDWFSRWNKSFQAGEINRQVCVHAFLDDKEIWQYLPWDHRGWHAGGSANDTHIAFEICEPAGFSYSGGANMVGYDPAKNEAYFRAAWQNALALCELLCEMYDLTEKDIICHSEGHKMGIASNHADVMHWFPKHGESTDSFRRAVGAVLGEGNASKTQGTVLKVNDVVEVKASAVRYYPGGLVIPSWVKDAYHKITQTTSRGKEVIKGGKACVLLGRKVDNKTGEESAGIMTWVDMDELKLITPKTEAPEQSSASGKLYRVQVGAFSKKENADMLLSRLKTAGFEGYVKQE
jgi:N-acetylmuramoyl-L-alanine amidase